MATRFKLRRTQTQPKAKPENGAYYDLTITNGTGSTKTQLISSTTLADNSRQFTVFYSDRFAAEFTLSGAMTASLWSSQKPSTGTYRFRASVSKITAGGSNIETFIASGDGTVDILTSSARTVVMTPAAPVTIAPNERLILRVYAFPTDGVWTTGSFTLGFDTGSGLFDAFLDLAETVTTVDNGQKLYLRRTTTIGIASFMDLLNAKGTSTFTTAVVNTAAGGTKIQWTKTAGGAVAEWITNRFKYGWSIDSNTYINAFSRNTTVESSASANAALLIEFSRRQPDGTETLVLSYASNVELPTTAGSQPIATSNGTFTLANVTNFDEDDRMVLRVYLIPAPGQTMGGGFTATMQYDSNTADTTIPQWFVIVLDMPELKAETDPARSFVVPSGTSTLGLGNGQ